MSTTSHDTPDGEQAGIVRLPSARPFDPTLQRLRTALAAHGITLFAAIDHQAAAAQAGLTMLPATLLLFGKPEAGTPLMVAQPSTALDLPSKVLVTEDAAGRVWLRFNTAEYLARRHGLNADLAARLAPLEQLLRQAVQG